MADRVIVLDTETTGLDPVDGHRVVEIAGVELVNLMPTGREFHRYCNPGRDIPPEAFAVHGLSAEFLAHYPPFEALADDFLEFVAGATVVAHNAPFDWKFLQAELALCRRPPLRFEPVCTLTMARRRFPGAPASLEALCRRFAIDLSERDKHGALIDTKLLAKVYLELMGGKEPGFALGAAASSAATVVTRRAFRPARPHAPSPEELSAFQAMLDTLPDPLWAQTI